MQLRSGVKVKSISVCVLLFSSAATHGLGKGGLKTHNGEVLKRAAHQFRVTGNSPTGQRTQWSASLIVCPRLSVNRKVSKLAANSGVEALSCALSAVSLTTIKELRYGGLWPEVVFVPGDRDSQRSFAPGVVFLLFLRP